MVELVIKIPERVYNALTHTEFDANLVVNEMRKSIANGMLLPKGHGRLIDGDELLHNVYARHWYDHEKDLDEIRKAPTILGGDEEEVPFKEVVKDYITATYGDINNL